MKKAALTVLSLFIVTAAATSIQALQSESASLNPPLKLNNTYFKELCSALVTAFDLYTLDAVRRIDKETIIREYGSRLSNPDVRFALDRIDTKRKGWTRYYPVTIEGRQFIVRVFLSRERPYQEDLPAIEEMSFRDPEVTIQILPGINDIIGSERIRPIRIEMGSPVDRSS